MPLNLSKTGFENLYLIDPFNLSDQRGSFSRLFSVNDLHLFGIDFMVAQANFSTSDTPGTIRGLHFQTSPFSEIKFLKVLSGRIYDVAVDLRKDSQTFLKSHCIELSASRSTMLFIPEGFAHGMQSLDPGTQVIYFSSKPYCSENEGLIRWNDPKLSIPWPILPPVLSPKDKCSPDLDIDYINTLEF